MAEFGGALDRWLEAPYVDAAKQQVDFEKWCEANDVDPDADDAWEQFELFIADLEPDVPEPPDDWDRDPRDYED
jgi:hypothetical protein